MSTPDILDTIFGYFEEDKPTLFSILRVCKEWYLAAVGPLWAHGSISDLIRHVAFPERRAHYAAWLRSRGTTFDFWGAPPDLNFPRLQTCCFYYWSLAGSGVERLRTLKPLLQPALRELISDAPAISQGMGGITTEMDNDVIWLSETPRLSPSLACAEFHAINVEPIHLTQFIESSQSLTRIVLGLNVSHLLDQSVLSALAFSGSLRVLVLEGSSVTPVQVSTIASPTSCRQPFEGLQQLTVGCDNGAGRVAALLLQTARSLTTLELTFYDSHSDWVDSEDGSVFQAIGNLSHLENCTLAMPHHLQLRADFLQRLSGLQHLKFFRTWAIDWPETAPAAIDFASYDIIRLFDSLPSLEEMCIHTAVFVHNEQSTERQRIDEIRQILDHGSLTPGLIRVNPLEDEAQSSGWEPPVADPGLMLGINLNFVPGGSPVVLQEH